MRWAGTCGHQPWGRRRYTCRARTGTTPISPGTATWTSSSRVPVCSAAVVRGRDALARVRPGIQGGAPVADPVPEPVEHRPVARDPVAGRLLRVQKVGVLRHSRLLVFDGPRPCPGRRGRMCGYRSEKPVAVHGRSATPETATHERTHEDRRGQDDDRSRRLRAGDHPAGPRIVAPAGVARDEPDESRAAIRWDGTNVRKSEGSAVRCRGNSRQLRQVSPSGTLDSARDHATVDGLLFGTQIRRRSARQSIDALPFREVMRRRRTTNAPANH